MSGGSEEPESHTDEQCKHCRRWFDYRGIYGHQQDCPVKKVKEDLGLTVVFDDPEPTHSSEGIEELGEDTPEGDDGEGVTPEPVAPDAEAAAERAVATDGGARKPPEPELEDAGDPTPEEQEEPATVDCPNCGADTGETPDALTVGATYRCTDCNTRFRYTGGEA